MAANDVWRQLAPQPHSDSDSHSAVGCVVLYGGTMVDRGLGVTVASAFSGGTVSVNHGGRCVVSSGGMAARVNLDNGELVTLAGATVYYITLTDGEAELAGQYDATIGAGTLVRSAEVGWQSRLILDGGTAVNIRETGGNVNGSPVTFLPSTFAVNTSAAGITTVHSRTLDSGSTHGSQSLVVYDGGRAVGCTLDESVVQVESGGHLLGTTLTNYTGVTVSSGGECSVHGTVISSAVGSGYTRYRLSGGTVLVYDGASFTVL